MKLDSDFHSPRAVQIQQMFQRHATNLRAGSHQKTAKLHGHTVVLTGSTGSLGSYILSSLLDHDNVTRVYCLNRTVDAQTNQISRFREKGLDTNRATDSRITYITVDLANEKLGLDYTTWSLFQEEVDVIIHNAWTVNFVVPLQAFENVHVKGTRTLIDLALTATHRVHMCLISSTSTVYFWPKKHIGAVPEEFIRDPELPLHIGYSEAKYVAEFLMDEASAEAGLNASIIRLGQVGGPTTSTGVWNPHDVFPIIIATSIKLGMVPVITGFGGAVDWIPLVS